MKILYIKSNFKSDENSCTNQISNSFVDSYRKYNPKDEIQTLDLYKMKIPHLTAKDFYDSQKGKGYLISLAEEFKKYDKFIFSVPMWNLTIPSILVAYLDYIIAPNITFKYDLEGHLIGMLKGKNKKAIYIGTRGGFYKNTPLEKLACDDIIVKYNMQMIGIENFTSYIVEGLESQVSKKEFIIKNSLLELDKIAKDF